MRSTSSSITLPVFFSLFSLISIAASAPVATTSIESGFVNPPQDSRPSIFAFMLPFGPVADEAITKDVIEMKAKGFASCLIYTPGSGNIPRGNTKIVFGETSNSIVKTNEFGGPGTKGIPEIGGNRQWSAEWLHTVRTAAATAHRVGLDLGLCIGGIGCEIGDLPPEYAEQTLVFSKTDLPPGAKSGVLLPMPGNVPMKGNEAIYYRDVAVIALPVSARKNATPISSVVNITGKMNAEGKLDWTPPAGSWTVVRFGQTVTPKAGVIDHLSAEALQRKWDSTSAKLLASMSKDERAALSYLECDSYEGKPETWTKLFPQEFAKMRGYDMLPWLPVLAGAIIESGEKSEHFKQDYALTISDLFAKNHYQKHQSLAAANGLKFYSEAAGPHQTQTDVLKSLSRCDLPMGEFWSVGSHRGADDERRFLLRDAAAASHGYGMKKVVAEAFTGGNDPWRESPFYLKACGDQAFCDGLTHPIFHGYAVAPTLDDEPGITYWAGINFNRHTTWWDDSTAFLIYLGRCSHLLTQGVFAADVAFYNNDGIGRAIPRKAVLGAQLKGLYDYDHFNNEILLTRMATKNGRVVLPDGVSYRVLALQKSELMPLSALRKFAELVKSGATLVGPRPTGLSGMPDAKDGTPEFNQCVADLWGNAPASGIVARKVGKGRVIENTNAYDFLKSDSVPADFTSSGLTEKGAIDWIHRKLPDGDLYFLASKWRPTETLQCTFRVSGKIPEIWDPVTGKISEAGAFNQKADTTTVPLRFDAYGSVFVVFRKSTTEKTRSGSNWLALKNVLTIETPWKVAFDPKRGGPETASFESLIDWTTRPEDGIKYYSGKATYSTAFDVSTVPKGRFF